MKKLVFVYVYEKSNNEKKYSKLSWMTFNAQNDLSINFGTIEPGKIIMNRKNLKYNIFYRFYQCWYLPPVVYTYYHPVYKMMEWLFTCNKRNKSIITVTLN